MRYLMQAVDSVDGDLYTWPSEAPDFAGDGYPGPNAATNVAILCAPNLPDHTGALKFVAMAGLGPHDIAVGEVAVFDQWDIDDTLNAPADPSVGDMFGVIASLASSAGTLTLTVDGNGQSILDPFALVPDIGGTSTTEALIITRYQRIATAIWQYNGTMWLPLNFSDSEKNDSNVVVFPSLAGNAHNVGLDGVIDADVWYWSSTITTAAVTGIDASTLRDRTNIKHLLITGANPIVLQHQNTGSLAGNRFTLPGSVDLVLQPGDVVRLVYDEANTTWRVLGADRSRGFDTPETFATTTLTVGLKHANKQTRYTGSSTTTVTVPPYNSVPLPIGTLLHFTQAGTGLMEFLAGSGVAINAFTWSQFISTGTFAQMFLRKVATNTWDMWGDMQEIVRSISNSHSTQQDDYNPLFWQDARLVGVNPTSAMSITGFTSPQPSGVNFLYYWEHMKWVYNRHASNNLTIKHQSTSSTASNRVIASTGADIIIGPNQGKPMLYDGSTGRWRMFA